MPILLTKEQLEEIRAIIDRHHAAVIFHLTSFETLTEAEQQLLEDAGVDLDDSDESIRYSYLYGQFLGMHPGSDTEKMSYETFKKRVEETPLPLSQPEKLAVENAALTTGVHIRHLGARVTQSIESAIFEEDKQAARQLRQKIQDETVKNVVKRESISQLKTELGKLGEGYERDWYRVAITEKHKAMQRGLLDYYAKDTGDDTLVFVRPKGDACKHCQRLFLGGDSQPLIFKLTDLEANGTNHGVKAVDWLPVVPPVHPWCFCTLNRIPAGYGFDEEGRMIPKGKYGERYEPPEDDEDAEKSEPPPTLTKAYVKELAAQSSPMGNRNITGHGSNIMAKIAPKHMQRKGAQKQPLMENLEDELEDDDDEVPKHPERTETPWKGQARRKQKFVIPLNMVEMHARARADGKEAGKTLKKMGRERVEGAIKNEVHPV